MDTEKKESLLNSSNQIEKVELSRILRFIIFLTFVALSIVMSGDNGVLSSSSKMIKKDLGLSDSEYGLFGSIPSTGRIIGSLVFMGLLATDNRKLLTVCCLGINASMFFVYLLTKNKFILFGVRFTIGTVRIYPHIYIPVWVDQFGIKPLKTLMMTVINITSPLGQVVGYAIGTFNVPEKWPYSFALVGCLIWGIGSIIIISPSKYFSARYSFIGYQDGEKLVPTSNQRTGNSLFASGEIQTKKKAKGGSMLEILKKQAFIFSAYTRANLLFIFQVIHLFITDYVTNGLKIQDKKEILKYYGPASVLGPTLGGSFGGFISTSVGGYENKKSVWVCVGFGSLTLLMTFPLAFATSMKVLGACLFGFFFCASAVLPTVVGYIISSIPKAHKGAGSSLNLLISTLAGNLPGPIIYGFINDRMKSKNPTFAWKCTVFYYMLGYCSLLIACLFRYKDLLKKEEEDKEARGGFAEGIANATGDQYKLDDKLKAKPVEGSGDVEMQNQPHEEEPKNKSKPVEEKAPEEKKNEEKPPEEKPSEEKPPEEKPKKKKKKKDK